MVAGESRGKGRVMRAESEALGFQSTTIHCTCTCHRKVFGNLRARIDESLRGEVQSRVMRDISKDSRAHRVIYVLGHLLRSYFAISKNWDGVGISTCVSNFMGQTSAKFSLDPVIVTDVI